MSGFLNGAIFGVNDDGPQFPHKRTGAIEVLVNVLGVGVLPVSYTHLSDEDFGKQAKWLTPIDTPPFYGIHRHVRVSAIVSGVNVDKHMQVLKDGTEEPIPGLFAIGNVAGNFFAGVDYTMWMPGLSLGRAHTQGYVIGKYVAEL